MIAILKRADACNKECTRCKRLCTLRQMPRVSCRRMFGRIMEVMVSMLLEVGAPEEHRDAASAPMSMAAFWRRLEAIEMHPRRSSFNAMLAVAELGRKLVAPAEKSCHPPRRGRWDRLGVSIEWIDIEGELRPILYRAPLPGRRIVILVHGLFDSKYSRYLETTAALLIEQGHGVAIPDMRGHGCRFFDSPPSLGPREAQDLVDLAAWIQDRVPDGEIGLVGFSLGALSVIHALAHPSAAQRFIAGGVVFCPPGDLGVAIARLDRRPGDIYSGIFRRWLRPLLRRWKIVGQHGANFRDAIDWLAAHWGYKSTSDFIAAVNAASQFPRVSRPLAIYAAYDDPFFQPEAISHLSTAPRSSFVRLLPTKTGGHLGHLLVDPAWFTASLHAFFTTSNVVH